jgi:outer membrane protein assembly factor BamD
MSSRRPLLLISLLGLVLGACASRGPVFTNMDADTLFQYGMERLADRRWGDAADAFQNLLLMHANHPHSEEARFRLGEAYQGRREWITAAAEFNRVAIEYPAGTWADDARFQTCRSYAQLAPKPQLDQEYTRVAVEHCRSLLAYYPDSEYAPAAQQLISELIERMAEKDYLAGEHYFNRRAFDSAIIYYQDVVAEFPETTWAPRALLRVVQAYERLGYEQEASAARTRLLSEYPTSPEARQVGGAAPAGAT